MRLIDADALKKVIFSKTDSMEDLWDTAGVLNAINNAPTMPQPDFKEGYKQAILDGKTNFQRPQGEWITIADVMSVFDDFMRGDVDENDAETFLLMLKDKMESER